VLDSNAASAAARVDRLVGAVLRSLLKSRRWTDTAADTAPPPLEFADWRG